MSFSGSYLPTDVDFLLEINDFQEISILEKERLIQTGEKHYSEVLTEEMDFPDEYLDLFDKKQNAVNKKRKEIERKIQDLSERYKYIETDKELIKKKNQKQNLYYELENKYKLVEKTIATNVEKVLILLEQKGFIKKEKENNQLTLTLQGSIASHLKEVPCLAFAECMETNKLFSFTSIQLICFLSCFTNINVQDDFKDWKPKTEDSQLKKILENIPLLYAEYQKKEQEYQINTGTEYIFHYDLLYYVEEWTKCECIEECKIVLQKLELEKEIFLGEFVKALLKINNIACELEKIAELTGNIEFLSKLREIPNLTMKYVVTNQSLYI